MLANCYLGCLEDEFFKILDDGKPAPVGMSVKIEGAAETFTVGMRGEVFVSEFGGGKVQAEWLGKTCRFNYSPPENANTMVYAEPIVCAGVQR